jgi:hypothetical protein
MGGALGRLTSFLAEPGSAPRANGLEDRSWSHCSKELIEDKSDWM